MAKAIKETKQKKAAKKTNSYWTSGRRKTSVARVVLKKGKGEVTVNGLVFEKYFPSEFDRQTILSPLKETGQGEKGFDISILTQGGGVSAQIDACMLGIARALVELDENLRPILSKKGLLTRDPRMKERKKYGLRGARRAPQFSKR